MAVANGAAPIALGAATTEKVRTPLRDALDQFKRNKMAVLAAIYIVFLVVVALSADILSSVGFIDRSYAYQHRGGGMVFANPLTCTQDPTRMNPQWCFAMGADDLGRDNMTRLIYGARISLAVAFFGATISFIVGILYGIVSGYYGGRVDNIMMRIVDVLYGIPELPIIILLQVFFKTMAAYKDKVGPLGQSLVDIDTRMGGLFFMFLALGMLSWIGMARQTRGQVLSYKNKEFVEAARSIGARDRRIIFTHLLPNVIGPLIVIAALSVPGFIFTETFLSFLGLGVNPPTPSWGEMIDVGREGGYVAKPFLTLFPAIALSTTVLAFNFLGDGLRDAFDPRLRGE